MTARFACCFPATSPSAPAEMEMSYMKAWKMVKGLNERFRKPLVSLQRGGKEQGGAALSDTGREVLALYREAVDAAKKASKPVLRKMRKLREHGHRARLRPAPGAAASASKQNNILADQVDGKPLDDFEGPLMVVSGNDLRHSRWIRQVKQLILTRATAPSP